MKVYEDEVDRSLWWIDYVEGELEPKLKTAAELLLAHSTTDRLIVENLKNLKNALMTAAEVDLPQSDQYWEELKTKVMNQIEVEKNSTNAKAAKSTAPRRGMAFGS